jgi:Flp pilus assembly protein TadD
MDTQKWEQANNDYQSGDYTAAEKKYRELLEKDPGNIEFLLGLTNALLAGKKFEDAEPVCRRLVREMPRDSSAHCLLGHALYEEHKYDDAEKALKKAADLAPASAAPHIHLGRLAFRRQRWVTAEQEMEIAVWLAPKEADAALNLAWVFAYEEKPNKALAQHYYLQALTLGAKPNLKMEKRLEWPDMSQDDRPVPRFRTIPLPKKQPDQP